MLVPPSTYDPEDSSKGPHTAHIFLSLLPQLHTVSLGPPKFQILDWGHNILSGNRDHVLPKLSYNCGNFPWG